MDAKTGLFWRADLHEPALAASPLAESVRKVRLLARGLCHLMDARPNRGVIAGITAEGLGRCGLKPKEVFPIKMSALRRNNYVGCCVPHDWHPRRRLASATASPRVIS